jgi:hypothetical protein
VPALPLTFIVGYQVDFVYGSKIDRIRDMAEEIMMKEMGLLAMPTGLPTVDDLDRKIEEAEKRK